MKYILILFALFLCACGRGVGSDGEIHEIEWPNGSCRGVVKEVGAHYSQWTLSTTQFIAECDDGRTVYNLSNFTVNNFTVSK